MEPNGAALAVAAHGVRASIDFNGPLNALSTSPNNRFIAVGGRDVLKVVALETTGFTEKRNLRVGKSSLNFSTNDIRWHPHSDSLLATAATNGAVVIWNLQREGFKHVQERVLTGHRRAVNRICWHTTDWNVLISGSQDGTIKIWDKRGKVTNTYQPKSESVRDVRMAPFDPHKFAVAFENGIVQVWDIRKNLTPLTKFTAHKGLVLALDWHPTRPHLLASGGRDRYVKIWDLGDLKSPKQSIQTIASVGRIQWRPNCPDHIATSASLMDNSVHVWDIQRPFIPVASLKGHMDIASGIAWIDTPTAQSFLPVEQTGGGGAADWDGHNYWQHLLACSKDGTLKLHALADAFKPHQSLPTTAIALNSKGQLAFSHDVVDRTCASLKIHRHFNPVSALFNVTPDGNNMTNNNNNAATTDREQRRATASIGSYSSHNSDKLDESDSQHQQSGRRAFVGSSTTQLVAPPLPPKATIGSHHRISSSGNLAQLGASSSSAGSGGSLPHRSAAAVTSSSAGAASSGIAARHVAQEQRNASHQNLQSLYSSSTNNNGSGNNLAGDASDARRALHTGSASATSSPALTFLPHAIAAAPPQALVSLVTMQRATTASDFAQLFAGDVDAFAQANETLLALQSQFAHAQQLNDAFGFDDHAFRFLASAYQLFSSGKLRDATAAGKDALSSQAPRTFAHMCAHNALAAFVTGNASLSQMWRILQVLYDHESVDDDVVADEEDEEAPSETLVRDASRNYYAPPPSLHANDPHTNHNHYLIETRSDDSTSQLSIDTNDDHSHHNDSSSSVTTATGRSSRDVRPHDDFGPFALTNANQTTMLLEQLDHVNPQALQGFDPYPYDVAQHHHHRTGTNGNSNASVSGSHHHATATGGNSNSVNMGATINSGTNHNADVRKHKVADPSSTALAGSATIVHGSAVHGDLSHVRDDVLKELLLYYADNGDLQTCVAVAAVVSLVANVEQVMGKAWLQQIYMHYIDLLHQLRIYSAANEFVANCADPSIRQMNMKSTSVYFNCASCSKPFESYAANNNAAGDTSSSAPAALCTHCRNRATRCSICQLPVRGLYVWCPVCSHGGHLEHLTEWFAHDDVCPTGCAHHCSLQLVTSMDPNDHL